MKRIFILSTIAFLVTQCNIHAQGLNVYYLSSSGEKLFLTKESVYDIETKPNKFYLEDSNVKAGDIYIIEVYRLVKSDVGIVEHFFKSFSLSGTELTDGIDLNGVFTWITSPFVTSTGFTIKICKTDKGSYLRLKSRENCDCRSEFKIFTGE